MVLVFRPNLKKYHHKEEVQRWYETIISIITADF